MFIHLQQQCQVFTLNIKAASDLPRALRPLFKKLGSSEETDSLTRPYSRAGQSVVGGHRVVDVDEQTGVGGLVRAGQGDQGARAAVAAAGDGDLAARDVELGATLAASAVQRDVLDAEEVVAVGQGLRDGDVDLAQTCVQVVLVMEG